MTASTKSRYDFTSGVSRPRCVPINLVPGAELIVEIEGTSHHAIRDSTRRATARLTVLQPRLWDVGRPELYCTHVWTFAEFKTAQSITRVGF